jgi:hypothetical protein
MAQQTDPNRPPPALSGAIIAAFVGLGVLGLLIGVGAALLMNHGGSADSTSTADGIETPIPAQTLTQSTQPTSTAKGTPDYHPIPADPQSESGLDFGYLTKIDQSGDSVELRFDRAYFYTGAEAKKLNKGVAPPDDYLIQNDNPALRTFTVDPKASLLATTLLTDSGSPSGATRQTLSLAQFVANAERATSNNGRVPVWLRHTDALTGPVTAVAEQFLP